MTDKRTTRSAAALYLPRIHLAVMLIATVVIVVLFLFSMDKEYIWHGSVDTCGIYCRMAVNYSDYVATVSFDRYYFRKSLGALLAHLVLIPWNAQITPKLANLTLELISGTALLAAAAAWYFIACRARLSAPALWLGYLGVVLGQTTLKIVPVAQESPDTLALLLGLLSLWAYLDGRRVALIWCFVIAGFVQTQLQIALVPLILFAPPSNDRAPPRTGSPLAIATTWLNALAGRPMLVLALLFVTYLAVFSMVGFILPHVYPPFHGLQNTIWDLVPLSVVLAAALMAFALRPLAIPSVLEGFVPALRGIGLSRWAVVIGVLLAQMVLAAIVGQGEVMSQSSLTLGAVWLTYSMHFHAVEQPLKSWIAHLVFFGPVAAIILLRWRDICRRVVTRTDIGLVLAVAMVVMLSVNAESRHLIAFFPWLAVFALAGLGPLRWWQTGLLAVLAFVATRSYATLTGITPATDPFLMTWGPWWTRDLYLQGALLAIALVITVAATLSSNLLRNRADNDE